MELAGARVFLVEDEAMLMMVLEEHLDDLGCRVVGTSARLRDAEQKARTLAFDFAVLDVNLDGELSYPVATVLEERSIPFVFATGYTRAALPELLRSHPVLQKPFRLAQLTEAILSLKES